MDILVYVRVEISEEHDTCDKMQFIIKVIILVVNKYDSHKLGVLLMRKRELFCL